MRHLPRSEPRDGQFPLPLLIAVVPPRGRTRQLIGVPETPVAAVAESGPLEAPQEVRQDSQGDFVAEKKRQFKCCWPYTHDLCIFLDPLPPCPRLATDLHYEIHATSVTSSSFFEPPPPPTTDVICVCIVALYNSSIDVSKDRH